MDATIKITPLSDDETQIVDELLERVPNLPDEQLQEVATISTWSFIWLRREGEFDRAERFERLATLCRNLLSVRCPESEQLGEPPL